MRLFGGVDLDLVLEARLIDPSGLITRAAITSPDSTKRSVPRTTEMFPFAAAAAIADQARSRNAGSGGGTCLPASSIAGDEALREADDFRSLAGGLADGLLRERDGLFGSGRIAEVGECDTVGTWGSRFKV